MRKLLAMLSVIASLSACVATTPATTPPPEKPKKYVWIGDGPQPSPQRFEQAKYACIRDAQMLDKSRYESQHLENMGLILTACMRSQGWDYVEQNNLTTPQSALPLRLPPQKQAEYDKEKARVDEEVKAFAANPAHPYFDMVADDIAMMLEAKRASSLQDAYKKASVGCTSEWVPTGVIHKCPGQGWRYSHMSEAEQFEFRFQMEREMER